MDYAAAVNDEIRDLFAAGADIVQIDEPYMQARPQAAEEYGIEALNRALEGVTGETAVHICFGYAAIIHERPPGYSFLPQLAACTAHAISIETAQSNLDCTVLDVAARQDDHRRRARSVDARRRVARHGGQPAAPRARAPSRRADRRCPRLRAEVPATRRRLRQDARDGRRHGDRPERTDLMAATHRLHVMTVINRRTKGRS